MCHLLGSNQGPSDLQSDALPTELKRLIFCMPCGFPYLDEPFTGILKKCVVGESNPGHLLGRQIF